MEWHYSDGVHQFGPVTQEQFDQLVAAGRIGAQTLVWAEGMSQWEPYSQVASARAATAAASPARPAAPEPFPDPKTMFGMPPPEGVGIATGAGYSDTLPCASCRRPFPVSEMLRYENSYICPTCKPIFFQRLREGLQSQSAYMEYAGFWIRFLAKIIDNIIVGVFTGILMVVFGSDAGSSFDEQLASSLRLNLVSVLITAAYSTFFIGKFGGTPGKLICGLRVVSPDGYPISYGRAFGRFAAEIVTSLTLTIGYIIAAFDEEKRALHDRIASTRVIKV